MLQTSNLCHLSLLNVVLVAIVKQTSCRLLHSRDKVNISLIDLDDFAPAIQDLIVEAFLVETLNTPPSDGVYRSSNLFFFILIAFVLAHALVAIIDRLSNGIELVNWKQNICAPWQPEEYLFSREGSRYELAIETFTHQLERVQLPLSEEFEHINQA